MASKEDPAVQFWEFVQENVLQFHCENVSWEQASDKIPIKVVVELLGDLITHVNTCLLLRNNRLLFTLNWETIENGQVVWEHLHSFHLNQKRRLDDGKSMDKAVLQNLVLFRTTPSPKGKNLES